MYKGDTSDVGTVSNGFCDQLPHSDKLRQLSSQFSVWFPQKPALIGPDSSKLLLLVGCLHVFQFCYVVPE